VGGLYPGRIRMCYRSSIHWSLGHWCFGASGEWRVASGRFVKWEICICHWSLGIIASGFCFEGSVWVN
jgi:hypothetical protein